MTQPEKRATCRQSLSLLFVMTMTAAGVLTGVSMGTRSPRSGGWDYAFAINRAYYALFDAISALFLEEGRRFTCGGKEPLADR
jgi:hypothetical protein